MEARIEKGGSPCPRLQVTRRAVVRSRESEVRDGDEASSKTTEFYAMIGVIAAILIAAWYVGRNGGIDAFRAKDAWLYVASWPRRT